MVYFRKTIDCLSFERVEIFLRVHDRLPMEPDDVLNQDCLDEFCRRFENRQLKQGIVPLRYLYDLIKDGTITPRPESEEQDG